MVEWPGRCSRCNQVIDDWADAGLFDRRWMHKSCYNQTWTEARQRGDELPELRDPTARSSQLELPMLVFLLMFHFGLGFAVFGWLLMTQFDDNIGGLLLAFGIITPLIGIAGVAVNIISRRRIELIRRDLELQGGWKPGR